MTVHPNLLNYPVVLSTPAAGGNNATFSNAAELSDFLDSFDPALEIDFRKLGEAQITAERALVVTNEGSRGSAIAEAFLERGNRLLTEISESAGEVRFFLGDTLYTFDSGQDLFNALIANAALNTYGLFPSNISYYVGQDGETYYTIANLASVAAHQLPTAAPSQTSVVAQPYFQELVNQGVATPSPYTPPVEGAGQSTDTGTVLVDGESVVVCTETLTETIQNLATALQDGNFADVIEAFREGALVAPGAGGCGPRSSEIAA